MATAIPKTLVDELVQRGAGDKNHIRHMLVTLAEAAADAVDAGQDFTVPGICKLSFAYRAPQTKGSRWKKGDEVVGFGGVATVKDTDSPPVKARIQLKAALTGDVRKLKPGSKQEDQAAFIKSRAGKAVAKRKA